ncbi:response regulator [Azospirillum thermophilum]|uniref:DNA-binding response regulator n=1 Tax=Azospirillum thermophilum TaxID=2202148 RepID=A0A2S2CVC8_9PROT|nr:response regulator [Azospirillum thermophilum]AWK88451.1 DNA-binding response regulator [Azospirillum thermophilum]
MERDRHILVVDDDRELLDLLHDFLIKNGFRVSTAGDGVAMFNVLNQRVIDLIILDVMLPGEDGTSLCRTLRTKSDIPVIMLTAVNSEVDRIVGLEVGADDYLVKPFSPRELLARIRSVLRRTTHAEATVRPKLLRFAGWLLDEGQRELRSPDGVVVHLSSGEFDLLSTFLRNPQRAIGREELLAQRKDSVSAFDRSIDIQVSRLRRKLEVSGNGEQLIKTVRGFGYQFTVPVEETLAAPSAGQRR